MIILVDENLCIGAAPCVAISPEVFQLNDEGKAIVIGYNDTEENIIAAAESCPVAAIFLYKDPEQIVPSPNTVTRKLKISLN